VQATGLLCLPFWVLLGKRLDKRSVYFCSGTMLMVATGCVFFISTELEAIVLSCLAGASLSTMYMIPYSMLPDVIDEDELRTGKRREGLFVGFFTVMLKMSVTISLTLANLLLKTFGYVAPVASCGTPQAAAEADDMPEQSDMALLCIRLLCSLIPTSFVLIAIALVWAFPITRERQATMATIVAEARRHRIAHPEGSQGGGDSHVVRAPVVSKLMGANVVDDDVSMAEMQRALSQQAMEDHIGEQVADDSDAMKFKFQAGSRDGIEVTV